MFAPLCDLLHMSASRPPKADRALLGARPEERVTSFDDLPTTPYGIALVASAVSSDKRSEEREPPTPRFFVTAEAAPLLPLTVEESHVQPKASLAPLSASAPPEPDPEPQPGSWHVLWSRKWLIVAAATLAFVMAAAAGRLLRAPNGSEGLAKGAMPAQELPQPPVAVPPSPSVETLPTVEQVPPQTAVLETSPQPNAPPTAKTKARPHAGAVRVPRAAAHPSGKRPYTPTAI